MLLPFQNPSSLSLLPLQNAGLEAVFYDLGCLSSSDMQRLSQPATNIGNYLIYFPGEALHLLESPSDCAELLGDQSFDICLAGIGSSLLGLAAMMKQVSKQTNCMTLGVISHYGLVNLQLSLSSYLWSNSMFGFWQEPKTTLIKPSMQNCQAIIDLLSSDDLKPKKIIAHSRGAYLAREALTYLGASDGNRFAKLQFITLGAVIDFPSGIEARQYIGEFDWLGRFYSDLSIEHISIKGVGHHMNPIFPGCLPLDLVR